NWLDINNKKAEVIAGQYRLEVLQEYIKQTGSSLKELYIYAFFKYNLLIVYIADILPSKLNIKLQLNRQNLAISNSYS
ncbi:hypothetical protein EDB80DRAFT_559289, partial [Ilyonectria destructans]